MTDKLIPSTIRRLLILQKSLKRMIVSEMTEDIPEVATMVEESERDAYCLLSCINEYLAIDTDGSVSDYSSRVIAA